MILITGATGQLGRLVIDQLLTRVPAAEIIAGVRDRAKAADLEARGIELRHVDYNDPTALPSALDGVEKVLLVSSNNIVNSVEQHTAVIEAAKVAGVGLLGYTSILHADTSILLVAQAGKRTEPIVRESGIPFVILRNSLYQEHFAPAIKQALATGTLIGSAGNGRAATAQRGDYAAAAAAVLTGEGHENQTYELSGDTAWTFPELVDQLSELSGKDIEYKNVNAEKHLELLLGAGLPAPIAGAFVNTYQGIATGQLDDASGDLHHLIGRSTTPLRTTLEELISSAR